MGPSKAETIDTAFDMMKSPSSARQEAKQSPVYKPETPEQLPEDGNSLVVKLEIRRGRLALLTVVAVSVIIVLMAVFSHGVQISTFDASTKTSDEQTKLTDDYNSYSGHITSAFTTPLELFVSNSVQIVVLHFMVASVLRGEPTVVEYAITLAFGTGVTYLISNGFEAVNVQLRDLPVVPRMVNDDLFTVDNFTYAEEALYTSNTASTNPEFQDRNPITNTILQNLAAPRYQKDTTICNWEASVKRFIYPLRDEAVDISIPSTSWQGLLLQRAVTPKNLTLVANATDPNANAGAKSENLPMDVTTAANLLTHALLMAQGYGLPWGTFYPEDMERMVDGKVYPAAEFLGILPTPSNASETVKREAFLKKTPDYVGGRFTSLSVNTSLKDIGVTFSRVEVSPLVTFDSVTIEVEVDPELLTDVTLDETRYTVLRDPENFAPWRGYTMIKKAIYGYDESQYDAPAQINAQRFCQNDAGTEELQIKLDSTPGYTRLLVQCPQAATDSLLLATVGKRLVADALIQNTTATSAGLARNESQAVVTNLRKYVSFTVGRLAWKFADLAEQFHAECFVDRETNCSGLVLPLGRAFGSDKNDAVAPKKLLLSADPSMMPLGVLGTTENMLELTPRVLSLVKVYEPLRPVFPDRLYDISAGDLLMPHNIKNITWFVNDETNVVNMNACSTFTEDRVAKQIKNHLYIESPVQPTYTAGLFFLLQMAVVRETINISDTTQSLNFNYNLHTKSIYVSIPNRNAWFTIGGCIVLAVGLAAVGLRTAAKKPTKKDELANITDPHTIARVMLDEDQFPPMLLRRRVVNPGDGDNALLKMDSFAIRALSLKHEDDDNHNVTAMV